MKTETNDSVIEIDLECYSKDELIKLISYTHSHDITFNEAIVKVLTSYIEIDLETKTITDV